MSEQMDKQILAKEANKKKCRDWYEKNKETERRKARERYYAKKKYTQEQIYQLSLRSMERNQFLLQNAQVK